MGTVEILRLNIRINAIKIISLWLTTGILFFKAGSMYKDFTERMIKYEGYSVKIENNTKRIDSIQMWENKIIAYYEFKKTIK